MPTRLKKNILMVAIVLLCAAAARPQASAVAAGGGAGVPGRCASPAVDGAIRDIAGRWKDSYNSGNAAHVAALYTEDAYYLTQHFITGIIHGRPAIQAYVQRGVDAHYHLDSLRVIATGCSTNLAYAVTRYESTNAGEKALGVNLVVLRKVKGRWRIVAHEAAVPDPATAVGELDVRGTH